MDLIKRIKASLARKSNLLVLREHRGSKYNKPSELLSCQQDHEYKIHLPPNLVYLLPLQVKLNQQVA